MDAPRITSRRHPLVAAVASLAHGGARRDTERVLAEGPHLIGEALAAGLAPLALVATPQALAAHAVLLAPLVAALGERPALAAPPSGVWTVSAPVLAAMADTVAPQGLLGVFAPPAAAAWVEPDVVLALDGVQDPGNVGALARALRAFAGGPAALWLGPGTADPFGGKALRASAGASFHLPAHSCPNLPERLTALARRGAHLWALVPRDGLPVADVAWARPLALVVGGEGAGVSEGVRRVCQPVSIPMGGGSESLNAAQAGTIALYAGRSG